MQHEEHLRHFTEAIWQWYARHKRTLPWRDLAISDATQRVYMILVSEVMLQQTQVPRVAVLFPRFLQKFPTIHHLAKASNRDVLIVWRGMGYNNRALRLRDAARAIVTRYSLFVSRKTNQRATRQRATKVGFPRSMEELTAIPGIGPYTAAAIRNFAFGIPTPCVDVNIERILRRVFGAKMKKVGERAGEVLRVALGSDKRLAVSGQRRRLPAAHFPLAAPPSAAWHSALMDFGSAVCTKRSPQCAGCPLSQGICRSAFCIERVMVRRAHHDTAVSRRVTRGGPKNEPGRIVVGRFIPNRIIRGRIVDLLRDHPQGLTLGRIGRMVCGDWLSKQQPWLRDIVAKLRREGMLEGRRGQYVLRERV